MIIESIEHLKEIRGNKRVVFTNGCFDILHVGHIRYLQEAKKLGDILVVGLNSDSSVKMLKGESRPVNKEQDRAEVLNALECVDFVTIFAEQTADEILKIVKPNIYVKGGDYNKEELPEITTLQSLNTEVVFVNFHKGFSTTSLIEKVST